MKGILFWTERLKNNAMVEMSIKDYILWQKAMSYLAMEEGKNTDGWIYET